jgi:DNA-binding response OmpR family regulator
VPAPRILVVDDNPELLTLLSSAFEEAGYAVSTAQRGRTALDLARRERPDLAVVDILLPDLMGFDVAEGLKRLRIPFIFISGVHKGGRVAQTTALKYGALGFFEKPFERRALLERVSKAVPVDAGRPRPAMDVGAADVADQSEGMALTGRVSVHGRGVDAQLQGMPLELKPIDRASAARMRVPASMPPPPGNREATAADEEIPPLPPEAIQDLPPDRPQVQRGEVRDNLAQLFAAFYTAKETGELGLQRGQVKKIVYFEQGMPVFALSNLVSDRLGQFLVRAGKIDEQSLKAAAAAAARSQRRTGDVLIAMGLLSETERLYYVGQQIKSILYSLFAWEEGVFQLSFQARAGREAIKLDIHPANLVMRAVRKLYKPERLKRLLRDDQKLIPSQDPHFNLSDVELQAWEAHLLTRANGMRPVRELLQLSGKPEMEARGLLVALHSLRILDLVS